ncbi:hypothetical protein [Kibdelosporangium aridum]|uniref:Uncharacterized protein n=1 Tax=Kibdelosporangium aridum TaxID=2030 RepID=A0A1W2FTZ8_KIBAR|nr:hypothetical protein [Kibdelosporangium aridum]SMD25457.1 hypothetical protein SAMN05661093_09143 [Kibdelosporangium aridum]
MTTTPTEVATLLVEIGMLTALPDELDDEPWDDEDVPELLVELGVAIAVHGGDVDDLETSYNHLLQDAAACSGNAVTITDVRLTEDGKQLHFVRNGVPTYWHVEHMSDEYMDHLAVYEFIHLLEPDDDRRFHAMPLRDSGEDSYYVLATDEQAKTLTDRLGLDFG